MHFNAFASRTAAICPLALLIVALSIRGDAKLGQENRDEKQRPRRLPSSTTAP